MQKLQDSVFSIVKTSNLSPAVFNFLQPSDDFGDKTPLGGILSDTKHGWLALGPKFCVVDLRTGLKVAARTFGASISTNTTVTCVVELPKPLTDNSQQLIISLQCDDIGMICILHINGSQILRCMQTDVVVTELAICDRIPDGPFMCFDGLVMAGTKRGEIFVFDLNRASLIQALKDISQGYEHLIQNDTNPTSLSFLPLSAIQKIEEQRELAVENDHHLAVLLNENSIMDGQYIFRNPDGTVRMKAKRDHIRVTVLQYIPQLGSMAVGFNFGAFQIWNLMTMGLEFTSQVNVECLPVTHFGFQEPCDDPRAFCYLWVIFSVIDRYEEEEFPLAVMYSLTYQGKRMLSDTKCLYQDFSTAAIRFQVELGTLEETPLLGGKCISCHSYSIKSTLGDEVEDSMLNICQLVWECWGEEVNGQMQYGMLLFDLDQWYKDQMPATYRLESNAFMSATWCTDLASRGAVTLHARLDPATVCAYSHATRLEEHFYPNSLQYECVCLSTECAVWLRTVGIQRQIVCALEADGGAALLHPARLHAAAHRAGLAPPANPLHQDEQRRYLLSVALEARLSRFLKRCAHDWATGTHSGVGCTLTFLVDWAWKRAVELKENAKELTAPLFVSSALPDRNVIRCLENCVQQLTQLTGLMDAILTKCCNLVVPEALSEMEERHMGISCVSLYFQVVQWFLRVGLLPERSENRNALNYPRRQLTDTYTKRRFKLNRIQDTSNPEENGATKSCSLLYIDQLIEHEFGGDRIHQMWLNGGSNCLGLYPPPSLYALLRLYLLPEIAEEHKHSLVLYLLVDYSMIYDDVRYEAVIRRLMQFPTMFGLSNTAIKATQAFWHLDHRDFDFALDQLQCLTGNTLHEWQHNVVLSSLLAQKKTQAALQYLHVRKPAPIQNIKDADGNLNYSHRLNDHDKLEDWQSCCNLYLARGLVFEALDVVRMCAQNAHSVADKSHLLTFFFKGCRNTGNLSKILQITLQPFEEEVFVKYLENCNESQTSDLLIMYYLQQARYLEAERYNNKLKHSKSHRSKDMSTSVESLFEVANREGARDALVEIGCEALPSIAGTVARCALDWTDIETHVHAPKPMSVFVQAKSPKNTFTYKSSFIQDTIENASETWMNRPKMRRGLKRALNIEETPFICTPKLLRTRSVFTDQQTDSTPPKRARLNLTGTPRTPKMNTSFRVSEKLTRQMEQMLDMPEVQSPVAMYRERTETPHSILKIRRNEREEAVSPVDSRYLGDSDDEMLETASNHTHYSDSTNKHLRFTIPTASESGSTPSPRLAAVTSRLGHNIHDTEDVDAKEKDLSSSIAREKDADISTDSFVTTNSHPINDAHPLESPPKKLATEANVNSRKSYKDTVRARRSLSISANSSLSEDPNTSIESIADIPVTLINPRYYEERRKQTPSQDESSEKSLTGQDTERSVENVLEHEEREESINLEQSERNIDIKLEITNIDESQSLTVERNLQTPTFSVRDINFSDRFGDRDLSLSGEFRKRQDMAINVQEEKRDGQRLEAPRTPKGRRGIRSVGGSSTPLINRSRSVTPERQDSPVVTPLRSSRVTRSRSKTPELSPRSSPLDPIPEQPKQEGESEPHEKITTLSVPRPLRSRSKTPEKLDRGVSESPKLEVIKESPTKSSTTDSSTSSPSRRSLRSRSRTPEVEIAAESKTIASPRSLRSRSKTPEKLMSPKKEYSVRTKKSLSRIVLEANTFAKTKQTLESLETEITESRSENVLECTPMKTFRQMPSLMDVTLSPINDKSVLQSPTDSIVSETPEKEVKRDDNAPTSDVESLPKFTSLHEICFDKSILQSYQSSVADSSSIEEGKDKPTDKTPESTEGHKPLPAFTTINETYFNKSILHSYESSVTESPHSVHVVTEKETKQDQSIPKPFTAFTSMIKTDFERSVLHSHQSSMASPDASKDIQNTSSLITNDTDVDMKESNESQDTAERKEKEKIVEIEREINEIEGDVSDDSENDDSDRNNAEVGPDSEEDELEEIDTSEESSISSSDEDGNDGVISITDSSDTESSDKESNQEPDIEDIQLVYDEQIEKVEMAVQLDDKTETSNKTEGSSTDPLNQAQISLLTNDSSAVESDHSILLNYSEENNEPAVQDNKVDPLNEPDVATAVQDVVEEVRPQGETKAEEPEKVTENMDVVDTRASESETKIATEPKSVKSVEKSVKKTEMKKKEAPVETSKDIEKSATNIEEKEQTEQHKDLKQSEDNSKKDMNIEKPIPTGVAVMTQTKEINEPIQAMETTTSSQNEDGKKQSSLETDKPTQSEDVTITAPESEKPSRTRKRLKSTSSTKSTKEIEANESILPKNIEQTKGNEESDGPRTPVTRKRASSTASSKSKATSEALKETSKEIEETKDTEKPHESDEPKTPSTRKRTQSNASKPEEKTPEDTPRRRRAKTPTSVEVRKIMTRRASREMAGKNQFDESSQSLDDSVTLTPKRRSGRPKKASIEDNDSVASGSPVPSTKSKASEDTDVRPVRKGRKSVLPPKPDLTVIPEVAAEETILSGSGRLTRNQKAMLNTWLEPSPSRVGRRRVSTASRASAASAASVASLASAVSENEEDEPRPAFDVQPIDRISLLNKTDFEGPPDTEELQNDISPESVTSESSKPTRSRLSRAASESKTVPIKAAKIGRRVASVDVDIGSPETSGADSPARGRRASFNRACEALNKSPGRRTSTDLRKSIDSPVGSPAGSEVEVVAARRSRRASLQSNTSASGSAKPDTGKRSKKLPVLKEEDK